MSNNEHHTLDLFDELNRLVYQSIALVDTLSAGEHFRCLNDETVGSMLWLLSDRLREVEETSKRLHTKKVA